MVIGDLVELVVDVVDEKPRMFQIVFFEFLTYDHNPMKPFDNMLYIVYLKYVEEDENGKNECFDPRFGFYGETITVRGSEITKP